MAHDGALPQIVNPLIEEFLAMWGLKGPAIYLDYRNHGYDAAWCHVSAKHRALIAEGKRVHGWALWQFGDVVMGEHHSVWENAEQLLIDVTPPSNGGNRILFVRDDNARIEEQNGDFMLFTERLNIPNTWAQLGNPVSHSNYPCSPSKPDLVAYCAKLNLDTAIIVTDDEHG